MERTERWGDGSVKKKEFLDRESQRLGLCAEEWKARKRKAKECAGRGHGPGHRGCVAEGDKPRSGL